MYFFTTSVFCCCDTTDQLSDPSDLKVNPGEPRRIETDRNGSTRESGTSSSSTLFFFYSAPSGPFKSPRLSLLCSSSCFMVQVAVITLTQRG